jgi:hypothetical protein
MAMKDITMVAERPADYRLVGEPYKTIAIGLQILVTCVSPVCFH